MFNAIGLFAGKATFTVEPTAEFCRTHKLYPHFTYRVRESKNKTCFFLNKLTGPDNNRSYSYMGLLERSGYLRITAKSEFGPNSMEVRIANRCIAAILEGPRGIRKIEDAGWTINSSGSCTRCGHTLTATASLETEVGPECEIAVLASLGNLEEIPSRVPEIATLQLAYWKQGLPDRLLVLADLCKENNMEDREAERLVAYTRMSMRHFKKKKNLPEWFLAIAQ